MTTRKRAERFWKVDLDGIGDPSCIAAIERAFEEVRAEEREACAAYLLDRADQFDTESPCWIALGDGAEGILNGEAHEAMAHGEYDAEFMTRVRGLRAKEGGG